MSDWSNHFDYYKYAVDASSVFSRIDDRVFWLVAHHLAKRYRCTIPKVMRRFSVREPGRPVTLGVYGYRLIRIGSIKRADLRYHTPVNPYLADMGLVREELPDESPWTGFEYRDGQLDLKCKLLEERGFVCQRCGSVLRPSTARLHHLRPVKRYKSMAAAHREENLELWCAPCHDQQHKLAPRVESRMR